MIPLHLRNVSPCRSRTDTCSRSSTVWSSGSARGSYRFLPISLFIRQLPALVLLCGLFSWGCWYPCHIWHRSTNSVPLYAMVCITRFFHWSWSLAQDTLAFFSTPGGLHSGPVWRRYSYLARQRILRSGIPPLSIFPSISSPQCVSITGSFPHCMLSPHRTTLLILVPERSGLYKRS